MSAVIDEDPTMTDDPRIVRLQADVRHVQSDVTEIKGNIKVLQSDVQHLQSDVAEIRGDIKALQSDVRHLQSDMSETKADVKTLQGQFTAYRVDVADRFTAVEKELGDVRTVIERTKVWMLVTGAGLMLSIWGAVVTLVRILKP